MVDHIAPPGYFFELRHLSTDEFLSQYNINLARQVAMGSQLRLRFEQEAKLLKKSVAQVARRDHRIATRETYIKDLEAHLEVEINMKKATEVKNSKVTKELEDLRMHFLGLEVGNAQLSQRVSVLQAKVMGEERIMDDFEVFKKHKDERVNAQCAKMDARLDALSIDFDEELYPHMLTAIAGHWWVIGHKLHLAVMKCAESTKLKQGFANVVSAGIAKGMSEGLKYGVEHGKAGLELTAVEAYDPEADSKYVAALHDLKDLNYPLIDQLEQLKDAPLDVIMASLYLDSDTGEDAPQFIRDLRPSSSQLKIPVYPEVRDPRNPWACKEEILLEDAIAANISRAEKKKKSRVVCRTHGVGSAHHARSDGIPVSVPTVAPQGLQILLADAATQTEDEESPRLLRVTSRPSLPSGSSSHDTLAPSSEFPIAPIVAIQPRVHRHFTSDSSSSGSSSDSSLDTSSGSPSDSLSDISSVHSSGFDASDLGIGDGVGAHTEDGIGMGVKIAANDIWEDDEDFKTAQRQLEAGYLGDQSRLLRGVWDFALSLDMTITRFGMTPEAIEELIAQRVAKALANYEATRAANALEAESQSQNGSDSDNGNGRNGNGGN
ncbi:hypothetical protein Tco_0927662 [Tanacetum coccineum]